MARVEAKLRERMAERGVKPDVTDAIIQSTKGFALYSFPESHAISFAIMAYGSAWLKVHRGPEFFASLLNHQSMGFYSSATLVKDARRHGVKTRPVCVQQSEWHCTLEPDNSVRLGFCVVNGLNRAKGEALVRMRQEKPYRSLQGVLIQVPRSTKTNGVRWRPSELLTSSADTGATRSGRLSNPYQQNWTSSSKPTQSRPHHRCRQWTRANGCRRTSMVRT